MADSRVSVTVLSNKQWMDGVMHGFGSDDKQFQVDYDFGSAEAPEPKVDVPPMAYYFDAVATAGGKKGKNWQGDIRWVGVTVYTV